MRVLAVADVADEVLRTAAVRRLAPDLVVGCGDLDREFLGWLSDALDVPMVLVPGNHDPDLSGYRQTRRGLVLRAGIPTEPPWPPGSTNADGIVVDVAGLRIAGLGGCLRYGDGPNQYSERQQARRARRLLRRARRGPPRPVDLLLTHAPPRGVGDADDLPHRGFASLHGLIEGLRPRYLLHGHVVPAGPAGPLRLGATCVRNVMGHQIIDLAPGSAGAR